ncbi:integral membrane sensor signal transduction histidine kinase [Mahella australiensis 50-1 BON]|uniref:Integral membrane sensor signal transduction histidine kinase n=2 Tax=Mahella TaxID=252965 RepID=F3ZY52_MAHA5|nr:integral membrane sensor signal transduction histidine kinase [Mahella australiensis 50-1 BON]
MRKKRTIQKSLFIYFSLIIISVILIFVFFFYIYTSNILTQRASDSFQKLAYSISAQVDQEIRKMDTVSLNIAYSNLIKGDFINYLNEDDGSKYEKSKSLMDLLISMMGPLRSVEQINMYGLDGQMVGAGFLNQSVKVVLNDKSWFNSVLGYGGLKYISLPYNNSFFIIDTNLKQKRYFISLYRMCFDKYGQKVAIIETAQDCDVVFGEVSNVLNSGADNMRAFIFNGDGQLMFPYRNIDKEDYAFYFDKINISGQNGLSGSFTVYNPNMKENEVVAYNRSDYTGWSVLVVQRAKQVLAPVKEFTALTVIITIIMLVSSLFLSFFTAGRLTNPIRRIHEAVQKTELSNLAFNNDFELNSSVDELEELNSAFQNMNNKLKQSLDELLMAKQEELQAKMLALQSQMNSHFLYNSLATIGIMAEEHMDESIITMCDDVSFMLRYVSSGQLSMVPIEMEIEYVQRYLECMQLRYGSNLHYFIDVDDEITRAEIPKLLVQPLVENALKHGTNVEPPWNIGVYGGVVDDHWQITVSDNGPGFEDDVIESFECEKKLAWQNNFENNSNSGGVGLLNTFNRLKLTYKENMVFEIRNRPDGGAEVTIGGPLPLKEV